MEKTKQPGRDTKLFEFTVKFRPVKRGSKYEQKDDLIVKNVVKHGVVGRSGLYGFTREDETEVFVRHEHVDFMKSRRIN